MLHVSVGVHVEGGLFESRLFDVRSKASICSMGGIPAAPEGVYDGRSQ